MHAALTGVARSADPIVAFTSLARAAVPALADECVIFVGQAGGSNQRGEVEIRHPGVRASIGARSSVVAALHEPGGSEGSEFHVLATFGWETERRVERVDQVVADLLLRAVADAVGRERTSIALARARAEVSVLSRALEFRRA